MEDGLREVEGEGGFCWNELRGDGMPPERPLA